MNADELEGAAFDAAVAKGMGWTAGLDEDGEPCWYRRGGTLVHPAIVRDTFDQMRALYARKARADGQEIPRNVGRLADSIYKEPK